MTALLYHSYSSKLSVEEKEIIDTLVSQNRLAVRNFVTKTYRNWKVTIFSTACGVVILISSQLGVGVKQADIIIPENHSQISKINLPNLENSLQIRGGDEPISNLTKFLIRFLFITLGKTSNTVKGFIPYKVNQVYSISKGSSSTKIAPRLKENPTDENNRQNSKDKGKKRNQNQDFYQNSPNYSEKITFAVDGSEAKCTNIELDHILVKHGHQWGIDDLDCNTTADANRNLPDGIPSQVRTRLSPKNRRQLCSNLRTIAKQPNLELYQNYPISGKPGRGYLCPKTNLFIGVDENGVIRKAFVASNNMKLYLRTNCM